MKQNVDNMTIRPTHLICNGDIGFENTYGQILKIKSRVPFMDRSIEGDCITFKGGSICKEEDLKSIDRSINVLGMSLSSVEGVKKIYLNPYEISLHYADMYTWEEKFEVVEEILRLLIPEVRELNH